jgi:hypothetical protein
MFLSQVLRIFEFWQYFHELEYLFRIRMLVPKFHRISTDHPYFPLFILHVCKIYDLQTELKIEPATINTQQKSQIKLFIPIQ